MQLEVDEEGGVAGVELSGGVAVLDVVLCYARTADPS